MEIKDCLFLIIVVSSLLRTVCGVYMLSEYLDKLLTQNELAFASQNG